MKRDNKITPHKNGKQGPKKGRKRSRGVVYNTDNLARGVFTSLVRDLRAVHGKDFHRQAEQCLYEDLKAFREIEHPSLSESVKPPFLKAHIQMTTLLKKYRFASDYFTSDELEQNTLDDYFSAQVDFCQFPKQTIASKRVLQEARKIARKILGKYSEEEVIDAAKFGKKSSIGCPLALAHIDFKLSDVKAFSGTQKLTNWFKEHIIPKDGILKRILSVIPGACSGENTANLSIESLTLKTVPKSWKILRMITPLTLLGLFFSHGYGLVVTERLNAVGLVISKLQMRHRKLVKQFSRTRTHVTADLRRASDSILKEHCMYVLPRDWWVALKPLLTHQVIYDSTGTEGKQHEAYSASVLPMGNGATFPLETLVFYCIIKAIGNLANVQGVFSVYGDDLIYPTEIHPYVVRLFPVLGFSLNMEKTYCEEYFRESCGADFYRGVDVRPFTFPGEHRELTRSKYVVELYKIYNGLTRRWAPEEIRQTLFFLLKEIALTGYTVCRVPPMYPDTAGIKVDGPTDVPLNANEVLMYPIWSKFLDGQYQHYFWYMSERAKKRYVLDCQPYYWLALQGKDDSIEDDDCFWQTEKSIFKEAPYQPIKWEKSTRYRSYMSKGKKVKKKVVRWKPYVAEKQLTAISRVGGSVNFWA